MENQNLTRKKIKEMFKDSLVQSVITSFVTVVVVLGVIAVLAYNYRAKLWNMLALSVEHSLQSQSGSLAFNPKEEINSSGAPLSNAVQPSSGGTVVDAVKLAKPAVVSIIVSKDVPKYNVSYEEGKNDPLSGMFPGFFFQTPTYTPNGSEKKEIGSGSGFLISPDGLIVTNRHVVNDKTATYEVQLNNGNKYTATVLATDTVLDVALLRISASGLPYLNLGNSDTLDVGESVIAIGNALGEFKNTVSVGVVSGLSRSVVAGDNSGQSERLDKVIQTDAAINPGNSGGPLLNLSGEVIGINVAVVQGSSNVGFALPINTVKSAINSVRTTGKIIRPYVGVRYVPVTLDLKAKNNLSVDYGVLVARGKNATDIAVIPGSPADKAGILENDIILEIDGTKIDTEQDFSSLIRNKKVGDTVAMKIFSKGIYKTVYIRLEAAPDNS